MSDIKDLAQQHREATQLPQLWEVRNDLYAAIDAQQARIAELEAELANLRGQLPVSQAMFDELVRDSNELARLREQEPVAYAPTDFKVNEYGEFYFNIFEDETYNMALYADPKPAIPNYVAKRIHYPECWDTAAYPTLLSALIECAHGCDSCKPESGA